MLVPKAVCIFKKTMNTKLPVQVYKIAAIPVGN